MKKAFNWLDEHGIKYAFHDYKKQGITADKINEWLKQTDVTKLINTKGTTFKKLSEVDKAALANQSKAISLMMEHTSMIKRPIVELSNDLLIGFDVDEWLKLLK
jgi:arsenate reductase